MHTTTGHNSVLHSAARGDRVSFDSSFWLGGSASQTWACDSNLHKERGGILLLHDFLSHTGKWGSTFPQEKFFTGESTLLQVDFIAGKHKIRNSQVWFSLDRPTVTVLEEIKWQHVLLSLYKYTQWGMRFTWDSPFFCSGVPLGPGVQLLQPVPQVSPVCVSCLRRRKVDVRVRTD
jgi:hypothetical protein